MAIPLTSLVIETIEQSFSNIKQVILQFITEKSNNRNFLMLARNLLQSQGQMTKSPKTIQH